MAKSRDWNGFETDYVKVVETLEERTASKKKQAICLCKACNSIFTTVIANVVSSNTKNCGCVRQSKVTKHNLHNSRIYQCWSSMKYRCDNNLKYYEDVEYCDRWESFENFYEDMSETYSDNLTIDRIDSNGDYCKENCRWADKTTQVLNRNKPRSSKSSKYRNVSKCSKNRYAARVSYNYETFTVGYYETELEAAKAVDEYIILNKLPHKLNFNHGD